MHHLCATHDSTYSADNAISQLADTGIRYRHEESCLALPDKLMQSMCSIAYLEPPPAMMASTPVKM